MAQKEKDRLRKAGARKRTREHEVETGVRNKYGSKRKVSRNAGLNCEIAYQSHRCDD